MADLPTSAEFLAAFLESFEAQYANRSAASKRVYSFYDRKAKKEVPE
jgi:hypothetical protein